MSLCLGLVSCGDDEDEIIEPPVNTDDGKDKDKDNTQETYKNADLIGWWTNTPQNAVDGSYYRAAIHFIDDQVVEYGIIYTSGSDYATTISGAKYYWGRERKETTAYERNGNVIKLSDYGWIITIVNGKLRVPYLGDGGETAECSKTQTTN